MPTSGWSRRAALLAFAAPGLARAEAPEVLDLVGQPLVALAAHPAVGPRLRRMAAGRQRAVSEAVRAPGPPLALAGEWLHASAANAEARVLLAFAWRSESVALLLVEADRPSLFVPPRAAAWPAALRGPVAGIAPEIAARMRFG